MRRLAAMPGQRVMVLVSPGFIVTTTHPRRRRPDRSRQSRQHRHQHHRRARPVHSRFARRHQRSCRWIPVSTAGLQELRTASQAQFAQSDILGQLADGTGGTFFHNRNDLDRGLAPRRSGSAALLSSGLLAAKSEGRRPLSHSEGHSRQQAEVHRSSAPRLLRAAHRQRSRGSRKAGNSGSHFLAGRNSRRADRACRRNFSRPTRRRRSSRC